MLPLVFRVEFTTLHLLKGDYIVLFFYSLKKNSFLFFGKMYTIIDIKLISRGSKTPISQFLFGAKYL